MLYCCLSGASCHVTQFHGVPFPARWIFPSLLTPSLFPQTCLACSLWRGDRQACVLPTLSAHLKPAHVDSWLPSDVCQPQTEFIRSCQYADNPSFPTWLRPPEIISRNKQGSLCPKGLAKSQEYWDIENGV